ncbi:MAG: sulfatase [Gemmatimonadaceae bacterium]
MMLDRPSSWNVFTLSLLSALVLGAQQAGAQQAKPRNVVFILTDDQRYDAMGFHPNAPEWLHTPNLDRLARGGVHLANAFVTTALCSPSRASILTGQYTHRHGVIDNNRDVPPGTRFFPQYLQRAGYRTALMGKWHMGQHTDAPQPGFDHWISFPGQGVYNDPVLNVDGKRVERKGYTTDILTDYALDWLERQRSRETGRPFFLYLSYKAVHAEFVPAERHRGLYAAAKLAYPETMKANAEGIESWPAWVKAQRSSWHGVDYMYHGTIQFNDFYRRYFETLQGVDESVGRVIDYLEKTGLDRNTLVIFMGDNGFSFGEHGLIDKRHAFDESMRVPMVAWAPGLIKPGTTEKRMVMNIDIMPTVLEAARTRAPADHRVDGRSFLPLLRGDSVPWRTEVFYEYYWEWNFPQTPTQFALRTDRYKYINTYGLWDQDALFDLQSDPAEANNLIASAPHQQLAAQLRARLFATMKETGGLQIPLREPTGQSMNKRRPAGVRSTDPFAEQ